MDCSMPSFSVLYDLPEFAQIHVHWVRILSNHLILCHPLLLLPLIFPSIRGFSSGSVLRLRWLKYWSLSFSISPSNEYSGLISFRIDWFDLLVVQGTLKSLIQHHNLTASWHPTPVLLPGKFRGWRSLVGCCPWGHTESDTTDET